MNSDFHVFQCKLLSSISPNAPLQANLSAVMAPALQRIKNHCGAKAAIHVFPNPEVREWHALIVGPSAECQAALSAELKRRHNPHEFLRPSPDLPSYDHFTWEGVPNGKDLFRSLGEDYLEKLRGELLARMGDLAQRRPNEFSNVKPKASDSVIIIPLCSRAYPRLGYFLLWGVGDELRKVFDDVRNREGRFAFAKAMETLVVRIFTNFYRMEPHTYLPSYYRTDTKKVTLVCAEIRDFDRAASILRQRPDLDSRTKTECLRELVNRFNESITDLVEKYRGRVDQAWGSGALAVFGEYLDTLDSSPRPGCKRALSMAAEFVLVFRRVIGEWLEKDFRLDEYERRENAFVGLSPAVAVDHGEVYFDYVGSPSRRVYMALGDHVDFARQLVGVAGRVLPIHVHSHPEGVTSAYRAIPGEISWFPEFEGAPILLSQSAHKWSQDILQDSQGSKKGGIHAPCLISLPGRPERFPVYTVQPENVVRFTS